MTDIKYVAFDVHLKAVFHSQAIPCAGRDVYYRRNRQDWMSKLKAEGLRQRAEFLYRQLDHLRELRRDARKAFNGDTS